MKKRIVAVVLLLCLSLVAFTACFGADKEFSASGMTITLTNQFVEKEIYGQTAAFQSVSVAVTALKESFSSLGISRDSYTLKEYTELVLKANRLSSSITNGERYFSFTYEKTVSEKEYYYFATTFKTFDAFWLIQFGCLKKDQERYQPKFEKWADSVVFDV